MRTRPPAPETNGPAAAGPTRRPHDRPPAERRRRVAEAVDRGRLVETALQLMRAPSRTGSAGAAADALAELLSAAGFAVERVEAGHPAAPAVVARLESGRPGRTLQFDGHLDTVHIPYVPPAVCDGRLTGTGAADMKAGLAAAVEALMALHDTGSLTAGSVLFTAHDLHEAPWGDGRQLDALIRAGYVGDGVLIPEYFNACLPLAGRGGLVWMAAVRRPGPPVHEVNRPDEPSVIAAAAEAIGRLGRLDRDLAARRHPLAGPETAFVGTVHSGSIYNEFPQECRLEGTCRWIPGTRREEVEERLRGLFDGVARETGTEIAVEVRPIRDAFALDPADPLVRSFQDAFAAEAGRPLPHGGKPFIDDGNTFWALAGVPAITHGATSGGAHTTEEWSSVDDLVRVARLYAHTALDYCEGDPAPAATPDGGGP